ncbi:MAG: hypothetical protein ISS69_06200 [Phycisphaerae bacterium]|nr:hypothetical protein [Phycisphaerae bacterium]
MRHFLAVLGAVAVASLAAVVLQFFAKTPDSPTGFGPTELKVLPVVIFFIMTGVFEGMGKKK